MARQLPEPAYRGFCVTKETPFGTPEAAATNIVKFEDNPTKAQILDAKSDAGEYTGAPHRMEHSIIKQSTDLVHTRRLLPWEGGLFLSLLGGSVATTTPVGDARIHTIEDLVTTLDLDSVTMWEGTPAYGNKEFPGICCTQVEIDFERGEYCNAAYTLSGDGSEAAGDDLSGIGVDNASEVYLKYGDVTVNIGGTYSEAAGVGSIAAPTDISALVRSGKITINNGAERVFAFGEGDIYSSGMVKGDMKADDYCTIELEIEPADSTYLDYLLAETEGELEILIQGASMGGAEAAQYYTVHFLFPLTRIVEDSLDKDGSTQIAPLKFMALKHTTVAYPVWQAQVINKVVAYLG